MSNAFESPIRILQADHADGAERSRQYLHWAGLSFTAARADTPATFASLLHTYAPDIVLAGTALPLFAAGRVLELARERMPNLPVIFLGTAAPDGMAIELLESGAVDYVQAEALGRLGTAVQKALKQAREARDRQFAIAADLHARLIAQRCLQAAA